MSYFPEVKKWIIPEDAFQVAIKELAESGATRVEGICLWFGNHDNDGIARITHSVLLRSPQIQRRPQNITILPQLMHSIHVKATENGVSLVGQIHSHSKRAGTTLSIVDRKYGFSVPSFLSIVAPDYCRNSNISIADCGVHVFKQGTGYIRLSTAEAMNRVVLDGGIKSSTITVY